MPGPRPESDRAKALKGNPGKRSLKLNQPRRGVPLPRTPPSYMSAAAKAEWRRWLAASSGTLTKLDRAALCLYCDTWALYVAAQKEAQRAAVTQKDEGAKMGRTSAELRAVNALYDRLAKAWERLDRIIENAPAEVESQWSQFKP